MRHGPALCCCGEQGCVSCQHTRRGTLPWRGRGTALTHPPAGQPWRWWGTPLTAHPPFCLETLPCADALTPEILRELDSSRSRGEAPGAEAAGAPVSKLVAAGGPGGEDPRDLAPMIIMDD